MRRTVARRIDVFVLLAGVPIAAYAWAHIRPEVTVKTTNDGFSYLHDSQFLIFGSDAVFVMVTACLAMVSALVNRVVTRREIVTARAIGFGAAACLVTSALTAVSGGLMGGGSIWAPFPPTVLAAGHVAAEPVRIHAWGVLFACALVWLVVMFMDAIAPRRETSSSFSWDG